MNIILPILISSTSYLYVTVSLPYLLLLSNCIFDYTIKKWKKRKKDLFNKKKTYVNMQNNSVFNGTFILQVSQQTL